MKIICPTLLALTFVLTLSGCRSSPAAPDAPAQVRLALTRLPDANEGAPLKIRLFMLRSAADFAAADFYSLQTRAPALLGENLLDHSELFLTRQTPESLVETTPPADTRYVGIVAEYQNLNRKSWRQLLPLPAAEAAPFYRFWRDGGRELSVSVTAGKEGLHISPRKRD